ncbi:MAG: glutamine synthetase, partial [Myxococcales bacterium]|nr:glutamine synthetase [Myxococcales bacterium]
MYTKRTPKEVLEFAAREGVQLVDLKFIDWPGLWQHVTFPLHEVDEGVFQDGLGF